jgi:hypothetical protein
VHSQERIKYILSQVKFSQSVKTRLEDVCETDFENEADNSKGITTRSLSWESVATFLRENNINDLGRQIISPGDWFQPLQYLTPEKIEEILGNSSSELQQNLNLLAGGVRELQEETKLSYEQFTVYNFPQLLPIKEASVSMRRFMYQGCKYRGQRRWLIPIEIEPSARPVAQWENQAVAWVKGNRANEWVNIY